MSVTKGTIPGRDVCTCSQCGKLFYWVPGKMNEYCSVACGFRHFAGKEGYKLAPRKSSEREDEARRPIRYSNIYVITNGIHYKLGKADDPEKRLKQLQTGSSTVLQILHTFKVPMSKVDSVERKLHKKYAHKRLVREWSNLDANDLAQIVAEHRRKS